MKRRHNFICRWIFCLASVIISESHRTSAALERKTRDCRRRTNLTQTGSQRLDEKTPGVLYKAFPQRDSRSIVELGCPDLLVLILAETDICFHRSLIRSCLQYESNGGLQSSCRNESLCSPLGDALTVFSGD